MIKAGLAAIVVLASGCGPSDRELGVIRDVAGDPMIRIQVGEALRHCSTDLTLRPNGRYEVVDTLAKVVRPLTECDDGDLRHCVETLTFSSKGQLDAGAWESLVSALEREEVWTIRSISQGYHTIAPETPDRDAKIAALPPFNLVHGTDGISLEMEWRREDGRKKYLLIDARAKPDASEIFFAINDAIPYYAITCAPQQ